MYRSSGMGNHRSFCAFVGAGLALLLGGCPTVDLGDTPTDINLCNPAGGIDYFAAEIYPNFVRPGDVNACTKAGGCHNEAGGNALNFKTNPQDDVFNYRQAQVFLNCGTPGMSQFLTKPLAGVEPHGGGNIYGSTTDPQVQIFLDWFE
ncbi:MAG TPA: hypothetical protein VMP03_12280 [Methylomirabilota bacterium]|nr:hypothetical protein [Methylomirabilota bacterium]